MSYIFSSVIASALVVMIYFYIIIFAFVWVLTGYGRNKVLKAYSYKYPWFAWIPFLSIYSLTDIVCEDDTINILDISIPTNVFKWWWLIILITLLIPSYGFFLYTFLTVVCKGRIFQRLYSKCERLAEDQTAVLGYISGLFGIIPFIKFLLYPKDLKIMPKVPKN